MKTEKALLNARIKLSEHCRKVQWDSRMKHYTTPKFAGAYMCDGKQTCLYAAICGAVYEDVYDGLTEAVDKNVEPFNLEKMIASGLSRLHRPKRIKNIDLEQIRTAYKQAKSEKRCSYENYYGKRFVFKINSSYVDAEYFLLIADTLDDITLTLSDDPCDALYLVAKNGVGIVLPVSVKEKDGAQNIKPIIEIDIHGGKYGE